MKNIFSFLLLLLISKSYAQSYVIKELDSITRYYRDKGDIKSAIEFNKSAILKYKKENKPEGYITAKIKIGNLFLVPINTKRA